jgi:hypothetical protein
VNYSIYHGLRVKTMTETINMTDDNDYAYYHDHGIDNEYELDHDRYHEMARIITITINNGHDQDHLP